MEAAQLADIPLLAELSDEDLVVLAERMRELEVAEGSYVVQQGELSYKFYVVIEGTASVDREGDHLADLGPGDFFGEMGIVGHSRRNADVVATSPMRMVVLVGWDLRMLMDEFPRLRGRIKHAIVDRADG
jgi:CRP/FNR family transcriptional regulator, cyclic AMP receptor protein